MKPYIAAAVLVLVTACAGTPFNWEDTAKIKDGMSEPEVVSILGRPYSRTQSGNRSTLVWSYAQGFGGGAKAVAYRFVDGRVVGTTTINKR